MAKFAEERGVAVALTDALLSPPGLMHYQAGPVTYHTFRFKTQWWLGVFQAMHDGLGWLVTKTSRRLLVFVPGDFVWVRCEVLDNHGDGVVVRVPALRGYRQDIIDPNAVRFLEERAGPIDLTSRIQYPA